MPTHNFPLSGPINLMVRAGHGSVTVETMDDLTEASITLEGGKHAVDLLEQTVVELRGPTLTVFAPRPGGIFELPMFGNRRGPHGIDIHVLVPTRTAVKISTSTAPIWIPGRVGGADLAFGSGEAAVADVLGDLRLRYGNGTAKAVRVHGSVQLRSNRGDVELGEIDGALNAGCGSGNLQARVVHGPVRWRSGSGRARLDEVHGDVDLTSGSGRMEIGLPLGLTARLDVHTGAGDVRSDLPIEDQPANPTGAITVRARTGSGTIRLFRAA